MNVELSPIRIVLFRTVKKLDRLWERLMMSKNEKNEVTRSPGYSEYGHMISRTNQENG